MVRSGSCDLMYNGLHIRVDQSTALIVAQPKGER